MELTRRGWGVVALAGVTCLLPVALGRPLLLATPAGILAWLVGRQSQFVRAVTRAGSDLSVTQRPTRTRLTVGDPVDVSLEASLSSPLDLRVIAEVSPPVGTTGGDRENCRVTLEPGATAAQSLYTATCSVAGRHSFRRAELTFEDPAGLFRSEVGSDETVLKISDGAASLTVDPNAPQRVHVGEQGEEVGAFGSYRTGDTGEGIDPAELRAYESGDAANRIDWKATARLNDPHVREFEVSTDVQTVFLVDCRSSLSTGPDGRTKLDYLREVALARLASIRDEGEAVGLITVGDEGILDWVPVGTGADHYARVRDRLLSLSTTDGGPPDRSGQSPADARRAAAVLGDDDTAFSAALRPFYEATESYAQRLSEDPLYRAIRSDLIGTDGRRVTEVFSDDSRIPELQEAARAASRGDDRVVAYVAPSVLFELGGLSDLEGAYDRYTEFEQVRRRIAARTAVDAYEVGPADRVAALTDANRRRARR